MKTSIILLLVLAMTLLFLPAKIFSQVSMQDQVIKLNQNNGHVNGGSIHQIAECGSHWATQPVPDGFGLHAFHNLILSLDPKNRGRIWAGCVQLFHSPIGGSSWTLARRVPADYHILMYDPGSSVYFPGDTEIILSENESSFRLSNGTVSVFWRPAFI